MSKERPSDLTTSTTSSLLNWYGDYKIFNSAVVDRRTATRFDPATIVGAPVKNLVVPKGCTRIRSRSR